MKMIHTFLRRLRLCAAAREKGRIGGVLLAALAAGGVCADVVHVYEETEIGDVVTRIGETTHDTGRTYLTQTAPAKSGYIFTQWSISTQQAFAERDAWGRAYDAAPFTLYEDTTLTAYYLPVGTDTDGDGRTFAEELAAGTNPLMLERRVEGPVRWADGDLLQYNPYNLQPYTVRSDPEGELFATTSVYVRAGSPVTSAAFGLADGFAYWTRDGVEQRDAWGRAHDAASFAMPTTAVELVAHVVADADDRAKLYWYGTTDVSMDSDTDGDGRTFAEELAAGTNPLMAERHVERPVRWADTDEMELNL